MEKSEIYREPRTGRYLWQHLDANYRDRGSERDVVVMYYRTARPRIPVSDFLERLFLKGNHVNERNAQSRPAEHHRN